jgi:hypothetical protein
LPVVHATKKLRDRLRSGNERMSRISGARGQCRVALLEHTLLKDPGWLTGANSGVRERWRLFRLGVEWMTSGRVQMR